MAMQDIPHFAPPKFDPHKDDFRCFIFRVREYCALYKLNVGMPRRHILTQGLPDAAIKHILTHYGCKTCFDMNLTNWATFDEIVSLLESFYYKNEAKEEKVTDPEVERVIESLEEAGLVDSST